MKRINKLLFGLTFICLAAVSHGQISVTLTPSVSSVPTGTPFYLDVQVTYDASCGTPSLQITLPANVTYQSLGAHPWGPAGSMSGSTLTVSFATPPASGSVTTNFQINLNTALGVICNGTVFPFQVSFITTSCGTITSNTVNVTGTASLQYSMTVTKVDGGTCVGGMAYYDVVVNSLGQIGAYNLTSPSISFNLNGATVVGVGSVNYLNIVTGSVPYALSGPNLIFNTGGISIWTYGLRFRIAVLYPCGTFTPPYSGVHAVSLQGTNPCSTLSTLTGNVSVSLPVSCCTTPAAPDIIVKNLLSWAGDFCPGSCQSSTYGLTFNNAFTGNTYTNAVLEDAIPPQVNVTSIQSDVYNQYPYGTVQLWFQKNGTATWLGPLTLSSGNVSTPVTSLPGWVSGDYLSRVRWNYPSIPPGVVINNNLSFAVINPDHNSNAVVPGNIVTNTLTGTATSPALNATVSLPKTVSTCPFTLARIKSLNNCNYSQNALPNDTVTFEIKLYNYGNQTITAIPVSDVLNSNFTYIPGSDQYYYGNNFCPPPASFNTLSLYNAGSPPTGIIAAPGFSANTLTWSIPSLPGSCTSTNYLIIKFKVKINNFTPAGTYPNSFSASGAWSNSVPVVINNYYRAETEMAVQCKGERQWDSTLNVKPGDTIRFRYRVRNIGNVPIDQIRLVNIKPMVGDFQVVNYTIARNSQYSINYDCSFAGAAIPGTAAPLLRQYESIPGNGICRNDLNLGLVPGACTPPAWSPVCNTGRTDMRVTLNPSFTLLPGQDVDIVLQAIVGPGAIGDIAYNSFGFVGRRLDLNIQTNPAESNLTAMTIDSAGCTGQTPPTDCVCGNWNSVTWQYKPPNENFPISYNPNPVACGGVINVACKNPIAITPSFTCTGVNCATTYTLTINGVAYPFNTISGSFENIVFNTSGTYNVVLTPYCGGVACTPCQFIIKVDCGPKNCTCKKWEAVTLNYNNTSTAVQPGAQLSVACKKPVSLSFNYDCAGNCDAKYWIKLTPPAGPFSVLTGSTWNYTFTTPGLYTLTVVPVCGGEKCEPFVIRFKVECPPNDCDCGEWGSIVAIPNASADGVPPKPRPLLCGSTYDVACKIPFSIKPQFFCAGPNCDATFTMTINNVVYPYNSGTGTFDNISFPASGVYAVVITPYCKGVACAPCIIYFRVKCDDQPPKDCCKDFKVMVKEGMLTYTGGSTHNLSLSGLTVTGMTPVKMTATVVSATMNSSTCGQNGPAGVGLTGSYVNTTGLNTSLLFNQPYGRDVILSGGSWVNGGSLGLNVNIPLLPGCSDKLTICLKLTFYDKDCRACTIYRCFTIERKWFMTDASNMFTGKTF